LAAISGERVFSLPPADGKVNDLRFPSLSGERVITIRNSGTARKTITLKKSGKSYTEEDRGSLFYIGANVKLVLEGDITLDGLIAAYDDIDNNAPLIYVAGGGTIELNEGVQLIGNRAPAGGGIYLEDSDPGALVATGLQDGAVISGNVAYETGTGGGAVYIGTNASYTLNSGKITQNHADVLPGEEASGGAHAGGLMVKGFFTLNGGEITRNSAYLHCGAIVLGGGGITLTGGYVAGNTSGDATRACVHGISITSGSIKVSGDVQLSLDNPIEVYNTHWITQTGPLTGERKIPIRLRGVPVNEWLDEPVIKAEGTPLTTDKFIVEDTTIGTGLPVPIPAGYYLDTDGIFRN
jgi:hypothetical protein